MYLNSIIAFFIATFLSLHGLPLNNKSVYDMMQLSVDNVNLKCPYVRKSILLEPEPEFLSKCVSFKEAQSLTALKQSTVQEGLCIMYYDNFEHLCYVSNNHSEVAKGLLSIEHIEQISTTYQNSVSQVCATLKNPKYVVQFENSKPGIDVVRTYFEDSRKCERICTDLDFHVKPICSLTAFMVNAATELLKETQNFETNNTKYEKGVVPKNKPAFTDRNADIQDVSNKHSGVVDIPQEEPGVVHHSEKIHNGDLEGQSSGTQNHLPMQNSTSQKNSTLHLVAPALPVGEQHNTNDIQSAALNPQPTSSNASVNVQGKGKKPEDHSQVQNGGATQLETTVATPINKIKSNKDEVQINAPVKTEEKSDGQQIGNNPNTDSKNNNDGIQEPAANKLQPSEKSSSAVEPKIEVKPNANEIQPAVEKPPEVDGNLQQPLSNEDTPNVEDTRNDPNNGVLNQDNKLSTNVDEDVKAPDDSLQDPAFLDETIDNADLENLPSEGEDYNAVNELPKSTKVKAKLGEKSKPLKIDEDSPSFSANYQNQSIDDSDSYFFSYFMMVCIMFICGYVAYHNKQKILALVVEGRKGRRPSRTRRPNSANYRKLDSNLEEAVTSSCNKNATQVIY